MLGATHGKIALAPIVAPSKAVWIIHGEGPGLSMPPMLTLVCPLQNGMDPFEINYATRWYDPNASERKLGLGGNVARIARKAASTVASMILRNGMAFRLAAKWNLDDDDNLTCTIKDEMRFVGGGCFRKVEVFTLGKWEVYRHPASGVVCLSELADRNCEGHLNAALFYAIAECSITSRGAGITKQHGAGCIPRLNIPQPLCLRCSRA